MNIDNFEKITMSLLNIASNGMDFLLENRPTTLVSAGATYGFVLGLGGVVYMLSNPYSSFMGAMIYGGLGYAHTYLLSFILPLKFQTLLCDMLAPATVFIFLKHTYESLFKRVIKSESTGPYDQFADGFTKGFIGSGFNTSIMGNNVSITLEKADENQVLDEH